jgi:hypothetical protein
MFREPKYKPRRLSKLQKEKIAVSKKIATSNKKARQAFAESTDTLVFSYTAPRRGSTVDHIPSKDTYKHIIKHKVVELPEDMIEREKQAQAEIERRKKCIAPAFNKGPYQYISNADQAKHIGK